MVNRVVVTIDGMSYTIVAEESEEYIRKNAALVDKAISDIKAQSAFSSMASAVLGALNIADKYYKALEAADGLRQQVKDYAKENAELRAELARRNKR